MLNRNTELTFIDFISAFKEQSCTITSYSNSQMLDFSSMIEKLKSEDDETK